MSVITNTIYRVEYRLNRRRTVMSQILFCCDFNERSIADLFRTIMSSELDIKKHKYCVHDVREIKVKINTTVESALEQVRNDYVDAVLFA